LSRHVRSESEQLRPEESLLYNEELARKLVEKARGFRRDILIMTTNAGSGHPGGSLSCIDVLTALYLHHMHHDPKNPEWEDRDRFVLSKGHACPALYVVLADTGYFPKKELSTLRRLDSILQGHPDMNKTPGVEMSTGSLGQGLSVACGMALAGKIDKRSDRVYVLLGDGEVDEGNVWEAAMTAAKYGLDNLTAVLDRNRLQLDGATEDICPLDPLSNKWRAFGWNVMEIDGHNMGEILGSLDEAEKVRGKPTMIIAHTVKGKGVSFMEDQVKYHGTALSKEELELALEELK